jgi:hypothetical protein
MGKNSKPILSVLVDEDKKEKFADLARRYKYSMGWLVNDAIDRMLAADSIDIYSVLGGAPAQHSTGNIENAPRFEPVGISRTDIEEMIKNSIANLGISSIGISDVEKMIKTSIEVALEPIEAEVAELKKFDAIG